MSVDKPRRTRTIWDIVFDEQVPDASLDASLIAFNKHKETILDMLRSKHERGSKSKPFDADRSWRDLSHLAELYFWEAKIKPEARPASDHVERLRDLAKALGRARRMAEKAMQGDIGRDLFRAVFFNKKSQASPFSLAWVPPDDDDPPFDPVHLADTIKNVVAGLATLETAANRAADDMRIRGRPKGTGVLSSGYILALALTYRESTGHKPGAGNGPFARFVGAFLEALGRSNITSTTLIGTIKDARREYGWL